MSSIFSHYSIVTPPMVAGYIASGKQATDEMLCEAFERIEEPFLSESERKTVLAILSRKRGRRFSSDLPIEDLARRIRMSNRDDVPKPFLDALANRLLKSKGISRHQQNLRAERDLEKRRRNNIICGLYRDFYELQNGKPSIRHPALGRVAVPIHIRTRSGRALSMTHRVMDERLDIFVPSRRRLLNIISDN